MIGLSALTTDAFITSVEKDRSKDQKDSPNFVRRVAELVNRDAMSHDSYEASLSRLEKNTASLSKSIDKLSSVLARDIRSYSVQSMGGSPKPKWYASRVQSTTNPNYISKALAGSMAGGLAAGPSGGSGGSNLVSNILAGVGGLSILKGLTTAVTSSRAAGLLGSLGRVATGPAGLLASAGYGAFSVGDMISNWADTPQAKELLGGQGAGQSAQATIQIPRNKALRSPGEAAAVREQNQQSTQALRDKNPGPQENYTDEFGNVYTVNRAAVPTGQGSLSGIIARAESGGANYNAYNTGVAGANGQKIDLENMTVGELMRRQSLPAGDPDRIFAAGRYQMIPSTLKGGIEKLGISQDTKFNRDTQDKLFSDYLTKEKRPDIANYITGKSDNRDAAVNAAAREWAALKNTQGRGFYDGSSGNRATVESTDTAAAMDKARSIYESNIKSGMKPDEAYRNAVQGAIPTAPSYTPYSSFKNDGTVVPSQGMGPTLPGLNGAAAIPVKTSDGKTVMMPADGLSGQAVGGGQHQPGLTSLAQRLGDVPGGFNRVTGFNDSYHGYGAHGDGRAMDFTIKDPSQSGAARQHVIDMLSKSGLVEGKDFKVLDEYKNPSSNASAGHMHVQFQNTAAAKAYADKNPLISNASVNGERITPSLGGDAKKWAMAVTGANNPEQAYQKLAEGRAAQTIDSTARASRIESDTSAAQDYGDQESRRGRAMMNQVEPETPSVKSDAPDTRPVASQDPMGSGSDYRSSANQDASWLQSIPTQTTDVPLRNINQDMGIG